MVPYRAVLLLLFVGRVTSNCEYGRSGGLFRNNFQNSGDENHVPDDDSDTNDAFGNTKTVTFSKAVNIFSARVTTIKIYDSGLIYFDKPTGGTEDGKFDTGDDPFQKIPGQSFAAPFWFSDDSGDVTSKKYHFTYKHLKRSTLIQSGLAVGPSMCDLQRIENIIFDCNDAGLNNRNPTGDARIEEALIVTWKTFDATTPYYMQAVVAVDGKTSDVNRETYVIFLYSNTADIPTGIDNKLTGFVNGKYATLAQIEYAAVCPFDTISSNLHKQSNCRCGSWNEGIYVFKTRDNSPQAQNYLSNTCTFNSVNNLKAECAKPLTDDNTQRFQLNCRPSRNLQDTCIEDVYCVESATANKAKVTIDFHKPAWDSFIFLDYNQLVNSNNIILMSAGSCKVVMSPAQGYYEGTVEIDISSASSLTCGFVYTSGTQELKFALMTYDKTDTSTAEIIKPGNLVLKGTCEILSNDIQQNVAFNGVPSTAKPPYTGRKVEMFISDRRTWNIGGTDVKINSGTTVDLGRDIYLAICYNTGSVKPVDGVEPYAIYAKDCYVSNNAGFLTTGDNRVQQLTETTGCRTPYGADATKAFFMAESFKEAFDSETVNVNQENFCQTSGAISAAKWLVGGSDTIYFRCVIGFCRFRGFLSSSKCHDTCGKHPNVDYTITSGRRRRDVNATLEDNPYPDVMVETNIKVAGPSSKLLQTDVAEQVECVNSTVAIATLAALIVLLVFSVGITSLLFCKVRTRQKKL